MHISELDEERVPSVGDVVEIGQELTVAVIQIDDLGRVNLSRRALLVDEEIDPNGRDPVGGRSQRTGGYRRDGRGRNDRGGRDRNRDRDRGGRGRDRDRSRGGYRR